MMSVAAAHLPAIRCAALPSAISRQEVALHNRTKHQRHAVPLLLLDFFFFFLIFLLFLSFFYSHPSVYTTTTSLLLVPVTISSFLPPSLLLASLVSHTSITTAESKRSEKGFQNAQLFFLTNNKQPTRSQLRPINR